jgi:hypothetical protein
MGRSGRSYSAFGPPVDGPRPIRGGLFARGAGGTIGWQADDEHTAVIVQGFPPLLGGGLLARRGVAP